MNDKRTQRPLVTVVTRKQIADALRVAGSTLAAMWGMTVNDNEVKAIRFQERHKAPVVVCYRLGDVHTWLTRVCTKYTPLIAAELMGTSFQIESRG